MNASLRILIAEDDETSRVALSEFLRLKGFECSSAMNGHEAACLLREKPFDLVIADIRMSGNENLEFARACAASQPPLPVILVTGYPRVDTAIAAVNLKLAGYLPKPVDLDELLRIVETVAVRHRLLSEVRSVNENLNEWKRSLQRVETCLSDPSSGSTSGPMELYLSISFDHLSASLEGLKDLVVSTPSPKPPAAGGARHATPLLIIEALREAISVLERTKDAFRSKELAELRRKLERLLTAEKREIPSAADRRPVS